ncbi:hypothetical protein [Mycoplasmopsis synoviae]|uniref:Uncharacterized protein n=1 Tax=Mycoplasmopsis synoviae TaxID=2109 RepID=A0A3B0PXD0_MYCSY|nr:hypothetical protein [Mycoplasmopsis synoviae]SYV93703.1 Uncharacterised protein [Mycoplasmopsis synoviae]
MKKFKVNKKAIIGITSFLVVLFLTALITYLIRIYKYENSFGEATHFLLIQY